MSNQETVRVLIAEDDYLVGRMIKGLLEETGYTVVGGAANGLEAVEMTQSLQPDVVLMDIKLPAMDGIEATRRIYESCPRPVVMLTAYDTLEMVEQASAAGAGAYLVKPPNMREMERAITIAIARFGDMMELRRLNAGLQAEIAERQRAEERIEHLNLVLRAIRSVNQLIAREKDRDRLLQGACESLIETRGYHNVWIALFDKMEGLVTTAEAGLGEDFSALVEQLKRGELTACGRSALAQQDVVVVKDPLSTCTDCPLATKYDGWGAMTVCLGHGGKVYGPLAVSVPADFVADEEEHSLLKEVAGDIAFALHTIELEEERKRAEEALAYERYLFHTLMDNTPDRIYFKDTQGRFVRANRALADMHGLSDPAEVVGKTDSDFFTEERAQKFYVDEQKVIRSGQPMVGEEEKEVWLDGRETWSLTSAMPFRDKEGRIIGIFGVARDITERKRAEEALKEYSERLEKMVEERTAQLQTQYTRLDAILRSTTDGIIVTGTRGEIVQANPVADTWLTKTLSPEDTARLQEAVQHLAQRATERPETVLELTGLDLELRAAPISEPGVEEAAAAVVAIHDISELKALDRMKSHFVTNVSHELRTPVTTIKLYTYLMRQNPEKREHHLDTLAQEADHLTGLVESILQISHIDAGRLDMNPRPTSLNELTEIAIVSHQALAQERGLTLEHHPAEPRPLALVDPEPLMQVLNNLVENGIYYTPEGGKVVISTGKEEAEGRVWATMTVADTGMGIPEEELPHTFERFFRGEKPRLMQISGAGLGLAIVKEIVELHGGRVTVESQVDVGTTFTVWLPLAE